MEFATALRVPKLIGRKAVLEATDEAMRSGKKALILVGEGGMGKTHILENIDGVFEEKFNKIFASQSKELVILDIVDFYNIEFHSVKGLASHILYDISQKLRDKKPDSAKELSEIAKRIESGDIEAEKRLQDELQNLFDKLSENYYFLFKFDTMETLEFSEDDPEVLEDCEISPEEPTPSLKFLKDIFAKLDYGFSIFAGRPTKPVFSSKRENNIYYQLAEGFGEKIYKSEEGIPFLKLKGFDENDIREYIKSVLAEIENLPDYKESKEEYDEIRKIIEKELLDSEEGLRKLNLLTDGRPIYIALALDWLSRGMAIIELGEPLKEIEKNIAFIKKKFEKELVGKISELKEPLPLIVRYAAIFRKGFTDEMMKRLLQHEGVSISEQEFKKALEEFEKLSFVKRPHIPAGKGEKRLFLHDEMFDLVNEYVWGMKYPRERERLEEQKRISKFISEELYGDENKGLIGTAITKLSESKIFEEWEPLKRNVERLWTEKLFYELFTDPMAGYHLYDILDTIALTQRRGDWDDLLHAEALHFISKSRDRHDVKGKLTQNGRMNPNINKDCKVRWLNRFRVKNLRTTKRSKELLGKSMRSMKKRLHPFGKQDFTHLWVLCCETKESICPNTGKKNTGRTLTNS